MHNIYSTSKAHGSSGHAAGVLVLCSLSPEWWPGQELFAWSVFVWPHQHDHSRATPASSSENLELCEE